MRPMHQFKDSKNTFCQKKELFINIANEAIYQKQYYKNLYVAQKKRLMESY